jgi:hypothetical protein
MLPRILTDKPDSSFCSVKKYSRSELQPHIFVPCKKNNQTHPLVVEIIYEKNRKAADINTD